MFNFFETLKTNLPLIPFILRSEKSFRTHKYEISNGKWQISKKHLKIIDSPEIAQYAQYSQSKKEKAKKYTDIAKEVNKVSLIFVIYKVQKNAQ